MGQTAQRRAGGHGHSGPLPPPRRNYSNDWTQLPPQRRRRSAPGTQKRCRKKQPGKIGPIEISQMKNSSQQKQKKQTEKGEEKKDQEAFNIKKRTKRAF